MKPYLKRLGALALCAVLTLCLISPALAEETEKPVLTDLEQCVHQEAVRLMVDLGVISGKGDGTFAPGETIDRASMAKLIYGIMMGVADPNNFLGVDTGLTDVRGNWAEGYINYCYSVGIISGSNGKFAPQGKVTVDAASKMLLVALGYDAKERGYEGAADWAENIRRDAGDVGLLKGISQKETDEITRDSAAQMIYNALFAWVRTPIYGINDGEMQITGYKTEPETLGLRSFGLVRCVYAVGEVEPDFRRVPLTFVEMTPRGEIIKDELGVTEDISLGRAGFQLDTSYANTNVVLYLKVDYTIKEGRLRDTTLQGVYSSEPLRLAG